MSLNARQLARQMIEAGAGSLADDWVDVRTLIEPEFDALAARLAAISRQRAAGLDANLARLLLEAQKRTAIQLIAATTALSLLAIEKAINSAFARIRELVNAELGFSLV